MSHIVYRPHPDRAGAMQLLIDGIDFTTEVYADPPVKLVEVGDHDFTEVGVQVTFALSRLDLGDDSDVRVTDRFPEVAERVRGVAQRVHSGGLAVNRSL